jgi:protein tyrosine phosphatase
MLAPIFDKLIQSRMKREILICLFIINRVSRYARHSTGWLCLAPGLTLVHCAQGHGRTGLFAVLFLLRFQHMPVR